MLQLDIPELTVAEAAVAVTLRMRLQPHSNRIRARKSDMETAELLYITAGHGETLHNLSGELPATGGDGEYLIYAYDSGLVASKAGRDVYDQILAGAPYERCPLCGRGIATTLDHQLPKSEYPILAITPANLVPACSTCNQKKSSKDPADASEMLLHPYFDNLGTSRWLGVRIHEESPARAEYFVTPANDWSAEFSERVVRHFTFFGLSRQYALAAAGKLATDRYQHARLLERAGPDELRLHLKESAEGFRSVAGNTWEGALCVALAESDWYVHGGMNDI
ncbi:HNH endonuclease [Streptomyces sp. NPDC088748]|uniref:HNH endonuclease n=1 Tax=Streptomyces sp. NPDC088748 TaxID=3365887 RepID=UPI0037F40CF4